ncbi:transcription initiation factor IIE alpha subunit [Pedobacter africanus]|uniref:Transcription initiation factor IIE alpha subunit n=1 Tax=Pedobacter africanus TaxID=151894 RepID=A0ACC6L1F0_9SPHI|nr:hypothetical protein [Pedobacter africanus]MDR6785255.1 transcription initiation factor IIE alpha subunit [Pedobacter africanus]
MKTGKNTISTRAWAFIRSKDSFTTEEFMQAMGIRQKEALDILQQLHDDGHIFLKWIEEKGALCFIKAAPVNDDVN